MDESAREKMTPGAIAMLIVIPVALLLFGIDAVILIHSENADQAAHALPASTTSVATPDASAPSLGAQRAP